MISDTVIPVGLAGKVVTEIGADTKESPVTVLFVLAVNVYLVFERAPLKLAGLVMLLVTGPEGLAVNSVVRVAGPAPPVQVILNVFLVDAG